MKKLKFYGMLLLAAAALASCDDYDDTGLRKDVNDLEKRVENLEH